jgi:hypothetical protein
MHYVNCTSQQMQKHKFGMMCTGILLLGSAPGPPELGKCCVDILGARNTRTLYVTHRSHRMQKHKFSVTCPYVLLLGSAPGQPENEKY